MYNQIRQALYDHVGMAVYNFKGYTIGGLKARMSGAESFGVKPMIIGRVQFVTEGRLIVGDRVVMAGHISPVSITVAPGATLRLGNDVAMNHGVEIEAWHEMVIGDNVMIAPYVSIIDDARHEMAPGATMYERPVVIGNNVWLLRNVVVLPGVTIGDGSVVAANSVVTKDIPPGVFAAGSPAKVIKKIENLPEGWVRHGQPPAKASSSSPTPAPSENLSPTV